MALKIKFGRFWAKSIDILEVTRDTYGRLDIKPKHERERVAQYMVKKFTHESMLQAINHLSIICFDLKKALFIRKGSSSFLADVIKAYVDKYDGERFAQTYLDEGKDGLYQFEFSPQSTAVFQLLWDLAANQIGEEYTDFLPGNISNKIWQAIILDRAPRASLAVIIVKMQELAVDSELLKTLLGNQLVHANPPATVTNEPRMEVLMEKLHRTNAFAFATKNGFFEARATKNVKKVITNMVNDEPPPAPHYGTRV